MAPGGLSSHSLYGKSVACTTPHLHCLRLWTEIGSCGTHWLQRTNSLFLCFIESQGICLSCFCPTQIVPFKCILSSQPAIFLPAGPWGKDSTCFFLDCILPRLSQYTLTPDYSQLPFLNLESNPTIKSNIKVSSWILTPGVIEKFGLWAGEVTQH